MTQTDKEIIDRITMVCQSDAGVKLGYDDTAWTDKEKLEAIQQVVDEISSKQLRSKHTLYLDDTALLIDLERQIKEILEK